MFFKYILHSGFFSCRMCIGCCVLVCVMYRFWQFFCEIFCENVLRRAYLTFVFVSFCRCSCRLTFSLFLHHLLLLPPPPPLPVAVSLLFPYNSPTPLDHTSAPIIHSKCVSTLLSFSFCAIVNHSVIQANVKKRKCNIYALPT